MLLHVEQRPKRAALPTAFLSRRRRKKLPVPRHWPVRSRAELRARGWAARALTRAVRTGTLIRARQNAYLDAAADHDCIDACIVGGQLTCVSELARWGVFGFDTSALHVRVPASGSRLRSVGRPVRVHWSTSRPDGWASVSLIDALIDAVRCQGPLEAIATLDSALNQRLIGDREVDAVFAALPKKYRVLRRFLDPAAQSGPETIVRLLVQRMGCRVQTQVHIRGVGHVDLLVDGWLIIECDSERFHADWPQQKRDRRRDQRAAALGYVTYRPIAEDALWHRERVVDAVRGLLRRFGAQEFSRGPDAVAACRGSARRIS